MLSADNDPLYRFSQWRANLRVLEVTEIDRADLEGKILDFQHYYNEIITSIERTPDAKGCGAQ